MTDPPPQTNRRDPDAVAPDEAPEREQARGLYIALVVVSPVCMVLSGLDVMVALIGSAVTLAIYWVGFLRANPRMVGLELIGIVLVAYYMLDAMAVLWIAGSALGGGAGAWLTHQRAGEDDFFFLPLAAAAAGFVMLVGLGTAFQWQPALERARELIAEQRAYLEQEIERLEAPDTGASLFQNADPELLKAWVPRAGRLFTGATLAVWSLLLWVGGRLARRRSGRFHPSRSALILFKMRQHYTFLLIVALFLEILRNLCGWQALGYVAWPLIGVFGMAALAEGLGVAAFHLAVLRAKGFLLNRIWIVVFVLIMAMILPYALLLLAAVGLLDVWFDFRRLEKIGQQLRSDS